VRLKHLSLILIAMMAALSQTAEAHHSVSGQFDVEKVDTWTGVITEIEWINPHIYLHLNVTEEDGNVTSWQMETLTPAMMRRGGLTKEMMLGTGGEVTILGNPARKAGLHRAFMLKITYPDGHQYQLGDLPEGY